MSKDILNKDIKKNFNKLKLLVLFLPFFSLAQEPISESTKHLLTQAYQAYSDGNIQDALDFYQQAAQEEDPLALYTLGMMYRNGDGVKQNYKTAFEYFSQSAEKDYSPAQYELGVLYELNQGVPQPERRRNTPDINVRMDSDYVFYDSFYLYSYRGYYRNYRYHSPFYRGGSYLRYRNPYRWRGYYGHEPYYSYGPVLQHSIQININTPPRREGNSLQKKQNRIAFDFYFNSALQGNVDALFSLGEIYNSNRLDLFSPLKFAELRKHALVFWEIAARKGHPLAQQRAGQAYLDGKIVNPDPFKAYLWLALFSNQDFYNPHEPVQLDETIDGDIFLISLQEQAVENLKLLGSQLSSEDLIEVSKIINAQRDMQ